MNETFVCWVEIMSMMIVVVHAVPAGLGRGHDHAVLNREASTLPVSQAGTQTAHSVVDPSFLFEDLETQTHPRIHDRRIPRPDP